MALKCDNIFVNLPVKDLEKTKEFFSKIGFEFNAQFTDKNAACLVIGDNIFAMLLTEDYFKTFTKKDLSNAANTTEVILALSADSREQVDEIVNHALAAGGSPSNDPVDHGFMYGWSFQDPDGHLWEVMYMDPGHVE
ncbi:Glyoxalase/bleomycin resistance protein/dioxygenase [Paenibacillus vortex V453]|jgi:predicted lactoylglutathione lyase|uniref:Extradiol dioxygenase n=2 Tax=Paenibacillus TaxID=44249 RepID=A0A163HKY5_9BACL|nr:MULTISPECIES: VOC family protein [Paenibacillus]ANA79593.1 extradiol dioxygenase [Paenibacillus glucanolyticus]AVV56457.1 glyoxalase/bleomycin resistance/extradiol dioxygenase family protein [Paenibacillus glucanolyticus]AWP25619.1 glyoxalase/bleomycin resistance/extradiol dioxygenase family protein [Paenibacillus sp. Cedars]EFU38468.1 Glyoxalase/bleomycin resistance protein/dioxygenase [Paenibacillus vortex V453]ETT31274.1 glyoxalase/bleomycin resistance protein/dioxygenase [Paenibacillus 